MYGKSLNGLLETAFGLTLFTGIMVGGGYRFFNSTAYPIVGTGLKIGVIGLSSMFLMCFIQDEIYKQQRHDEAMKEWREQREKNNFNKKKL